MSSIDLAITTVFFGVAAVAEVTTAGAANGAASPAAEAASILRLVIMKWSPSVCFSQVSGSLMYLAQSRFLWRRFCCGQALLIFE
jgi:hypothetical protein